MNFPGPRVMVKPKSLAEFNRICWKQIINWMNLDFSFHFGRAILPYHSVDVYLYVSVVR